MKEFAVYTALRLLLFAATFAVVLGLAALLTDTVNVTWVLVIAFVISGVGSFYLLNHQREAFARSVEVRAQLATAKFEERRAREDED